MAVIRGEAFGEEGLIHKYGKLCPVLSSKHDRVFQRTGKFLPKNVYLRVDAGYGKKDLSVR